ncbi:hypothetical protein [Albirhodobacter sp. R86504]|jgi:hypothetical protein|uniref:hypothetical protein n=1 Tax=Albirhodobacter sp. R86504 TaxID=3093848 RepID=UPI00366B694D
MSKQTVNATYKQTLDPEAFKELLEHAAPIYISSLQDLGHFFKRLEGLGEWVHTMEVDEIVDGKPKGRLDVAMLGLDGEDDWDVPLEPKRMREVLKSKIKMMREESKLFQMRVWMGEYA